MKLEVTVTDQTASATAAFWGDEAENFYERTRTWGSPNDPEHTILAFSRIKVKNSKGTRHRCRCVLIRRIQLSRQDSAACRFSRAHSPWSTPTAVQWARRQKNCAPGIAARSSLRRSIDLRRGLRERSHRRPGRGMYLGFKMYSGRKMYLT